MDVDGRDLSNKVFVVTGAGNGIGRCVALDLVSRGATVAGVDINEIGLAETGHLTSDAPASGRTSSTSAISKRCKAFPDGPRGPRARRRPVQHRGHPAGHAADRGGRRRSHRSADARQLLRHRLAHPGVPPTPRTAPRRWTDPHHLEPVRARSLPGGAAFYGGASKAAVAFFGYGLAQDLRGKKSKVTVTTVIPGTIWTDLVRKTSQALGTPEALAKGFAMAPEKAARLIIDAALDGRVRAVVGKDAHAFNGARRLSSRLSERMAYAQVGRFVYRSKGR